MVLSVVGALGGLPGAKGGEFVEHQLHADAKELDQLRVGLFLDLQFLGADGPGVRHLREVSQHLGDALGQRIAVRGAGRAEPVQESLAPRAQRLDPRIERVLVIGQQRLEIHLLAGERGDGRLAQAGERPAPADGLVRQDLVDPFHEAVVPARA